MSNSETIIPGIKKITPLPKKGSAWEAPNLYLVGDPGVLVDSGYDREEDVRMALQALAPVRLLRIILTHGHVDHAGGARLIQQATKAIIMSHPADRPSIQRRFPAAVIDQDLHGGDLIEAGGFELEVIHAPGHTPGHVIFYLQSRGIVFTGDLVTGQGSTLIAPPEGNMKQYLESLRRLREMPLNLILPGHGPAVTDPAQRIGELIEHRELRELCIVKCLAENKAPLTLKDLVKAMYLGLIHPDFEMAAAATAWAHLEKLIEQGAATSTPATEQNPFAKKFSLTPQAREQVSNLFPG